MFKVDLEQIDKIDLFFYDADHSLENTRHAVKYFSKKFEEECILVFDDSNFDGVVQGAKEGIYEANLEILFEKLILNDIEDPDMWWNGIYIVVVRKKI